MIRYYYIRSDRKPLPLIHTRETLQTREILMTLKPTGNTLLSEGFIRMKREIKGCVVCRLNRETLAALMLLILGELSESKPLAQSRFLFIHTLKVKALVHSTFSLIREEQGELMNLEEMTLTGYTIAAKRTEAALLKLELEGEDSAEWSFGKEGRPIPETGAFLFMKGNEVSVDGYELSDLAAFSLSGVYSETQKSFELMIRRKDSDSADYRFMRKTIMAGIILTSREYYEEGQKVRLEIDIPIAHYLGEENFPDNNGIWGREFRYAVKADFSIKVFTHLDDTGSVI